MTVGFGGASVLGLGRPSVIRQRARGRRLLTSSPLCLITSSPHRLETSPPRHLVAPSPPLPPQHRPSTALGRLQPAIYTRPPAFRRVTGHLGTGHHPHSAIHSRRIYGQPRRIAARAPLGIPAPRPSPSPGHPQPAIYGQPPAYRRARAPRHPGTPAIIRTRPSSRSAFCSRPPTLGRRCIAVHISAPRHRPRSICTRPSTASRLHPASGVSACDPISRPSSVGFPVHMQTRG